MPRREEVVEAVFFGAVIVGLISVAAILVACAVMAWRSL